MSLITKKQIQILYALGSKTGTLENGNKDDDLHIIVSRITGKSSIKELTQKEYKLVVDELKAFLPNDKGKVENKPTLITEKQKSLAWRFVYRLIELDATESKATAGERMLGAINKVLKKGVTDVKAPFKDITQEEGEKLIENLKRYVRSAERKVEME